MMNAKRKINLRVVLYSFTGLACMVLAYFVHWIFLLPVAAVIFINQRELAK